MRLHPLSLPYRAVARGASAGVSLLVVGTVLGGVDPVAGALPAAVRPALGPALFVVGLLVGAAWEAAYYRRFEYELTSDTLDVRSGVFSTRDREIPVGRIQNVDISRGVVQRLLGLAVASFETAGGGETEARLRFVGYDEAKRLQRELQRLTAGDAGTADEAAEPGAEVGSQLFELPDEDLVVLSFVAPDLRVLPALFLVVPALAQGVPASLVDGALLVVGVLGGIVSVAGLWLVSAAVVFARYYGFRLSRVGDELRYERGLVQRYDGSIPLDKVQSLAVRENVLMRRLGYAALAVETAGYSPGQSPSGGSEAAVPLASRARVVDLARTVEPFAVEAFERPPKRARRRYAGRYAIALGLATAVLLGVDALAVALPFPPWLPLLGLVAVPPAAHLKWRHRGYYLGEDHVVTRNGFWRRRTEVVPHYRIQTVIQRATVFQRRWDLATVVADTAGSLSVVGDDAAAVDVDAATAAELRRTLRRRMQESRAKRRDEAVDN